jgi:toxin ParE1/3/4
LGFDLRVNLSDDAVADLQAICDEIAKHNPNRAVSFVDELLDAIESLSEQPERFALTPQFGRSVRRLLFGQYCVYYRIQDEKVQVSRVLHGRRRIRRAMIP